MSALEAETDDGADEGSVSLLEGRMEGEDRSNLDDASSYYGLSHHAEGRGSGGISRHFEAEVRARKEAERSAQRARRDLEREVREHNAEVERTGVGEKWAMPYEPPAHKRDPHVNAEAYEAVERLTRKLQQERGLSFLDASRAAREQIEARGEERSSRDADAEYLGDSIENLMMPETIGDAHGGSRSGKLKRDKKKGGPKETGDVVVLASYVSRGAPPIEAERRDQVFQGRMSESTAKAILKFQCETGVNIAGIMAAVAQLERSSDPNAQLALEQIIRAAPVRRAASR